MTNISYNIDQHYVAHIDTAKDSLTRVVKCSINVNEHPLELFFSLAELKDILSTKRYNQLQGISELKQLVNIVSRLLTRHIAGKIQLIELNVVAKMQSIAQLSIKTINDATVCNVYFIDDAVEYMQDYFVRLHQQYMLKFSQMFNSKMQFPLVIAEAMIARDALAELKLGNVIMFDELHLSPQGIPCKINNLRMDVHIN